MPPTASLTDPIVELAVDVVDAMGLPGVFVLMLLESACIPVPSEATMLFAGFNVSRGEYSLFAATMVGSVANLVGSWLAYWVGRALPLWILSPVLGPLNDGRDLSDAIHQHAGVFRTAAQYGLAIFAIGSVALAISA